MPNMPAEPPHRVKAYAAAALFWLTPAAAVSGGLALAPLQLVAGLIAGQWRALGAALARPAPPLIALGLFAGWAALSASWSPAPSAWEAAAKLVLGLASGLALAHGVSRATGRGGALIRASLVAAVIATAALLAIEAGFGMPLNRLDQPDAVEWMLARNPGRGVALLLLLVWPALFVLGGRARWVFGTLALAACAVLSVQFEMYANTVAFLLAGLLAAAAFAAPRLTITLLGGASAALMLAAPVLARLAPHPDALAFTLPASWAERLLAWRSVGQRFMDAPLFGHGLDAARGMNAPLEHGGEAAAAIPLHPHNANLQIWLELGLVGGVLAAAALWLGGRALARKNPSRAQAAGVAGAFGAYTAHANLSFGVWQEWWVAAAFLAAAACASLWTKAAPRG